MALTNKLPQTQSVYICFVICGANMAKEMYPGFDVEDFINLPNYLIYKSSFTLDQFGYKLSQLFRK